MTLTIIQELSWGAPSDWDPLPDGNVQLWDVASGAKLASIHAGDGDFILGLAFSPDGATLVAMMDYNFTLNLWSWDSGTLLHTINPDAIPYYMAFSPDGTRLALGGW
jgi:WD40 repeat protein